jgi:NitT/TauT family transport system substrate-binding protein
MAKRTIVALVLATWLALSGCGGGSSSSGSSSAQGAPEKIKVLLGSKTWYVAYAPYVVAAEMGYYKDAGVEPELIPCCGSTDVAKQIAAGQGDIGAPSPEPVIIGRHPDTGMKVKYVYTFYRENIYKLAVPEGSPIKQITDFKGKTVGVASLGSGAVPAGKAMIKAAGLDPEKDVRFVPIGEGIQAATAIQQKRVDALSLWDALYAELETFKVKFTYLDNSSIAKFPSNGLIVRDDDVKSKSKTIAGFGRAVAQGTLFTLENPEAAVRIVWKRYPETKPTGKSDKEALDDGMHVVQSRFHTWKIDNRKTKKWGYNEESEYAEFMDFMLQQGLIKAKVPVGDLLTNQFVNDFNGFDEKKVKDQAKNWKP